MISPDNPTAALDAIQRHPGYRARQEWTNLRTVHGVHLANHETLDSYLRQCRHSDAPRENLSRDRDSFWISLYCCVHNYVASAMTLVDHTRRLMHPYSGRFKDRYEREKDDVGTADVTKFMHDLRNCILHSSIPPMAYPLKCVRNNEGGYDTSQWIAVESSLMLDSFKKWSKGARSYLETRQPAFPLHTAVSEHERLLERLYTWLYDQFEIQHAEEIREVNELIIQSRLPTNWAQR